MDFAEMNSKIDKILQEYGFYCFEKITLISQNEKGYFSILDLKRDVANRYSDLKEKLK